MAKQRARLLIEQVDRLARSDFPHTDGREALLEIRKRFVAQLGELDKSSKLSAGTLKGLAQDIHYDVEKYLPILGFILRSTNVRNAFEIYDPLKIVVTALLGDKSLLIISSEWDFVPFTYPMSLEALPNAVLIGGPAHESHSPFIVPLAGHEIGHSVWQLQDVGDHLERAFAPILESRIKSDKPLEDELVQQYGTGYLGYLVPGGLKRVEELFCDAFGYLLFGDAYAYAFERVMYPGLEERSEEGYPFIAQRLELLLELSKRFGGELPPEFASGWLIQSDGYWADLDDHIDGAAGDIFDDIIGRAEWVCDVAGIPRHDKAAATKIARAFKDGQPHDGQATLVDILNAGWAVLRESHLASRDLEPQLNETILKTIEVAHFDFLTTGTDAQQ